MSLPPKWPPRIWHKTAADKKAAELFLLVTDPVQLMADLPIFEKLLALDFFEPEPEMADWAQLLPPVPLDSK